ncbi:MAG TPA: anthranilate phosphoribosyltransferase [Candidatus Acidoferrales bacterium]|nr:anthranilate phosphoribosyltransferase [Candidatus Acidoferrales bacterium]HXK02787.1 anthranilate phosphoribosyltransferase [Verrucomicrobiae bacterium]
MSLLPHLVRLVERESLSADDAERAMETILRGEASQPQIAAFLVALRMKGETVSELVGFARAMRRMAVRVDPGLAGETLLDTCGTGGDGRNTFNISTVAAFVVAGAGVHVAKHGNRSISSKCGSADLLEAWGIAIAMSPGETARAIREVGIGFLFAPAVHTAMKHAHPVRVDLKMRTVFNLLGPLTNPAGATAQLLGAPSAAAAELMAGALAELGLERGFVVHGSDGLDEITTTGSTDAWEVHEGRVQHRVLEPEDFAVHRASSADLSGGDPLANLEIANAVLRGAHGPARDIVLVNAAAALVAAGKAGTFLEGMALGVVSLDSGAAKAKVQELAAFAA